VLQCVAVCCSVLQCVAVCCSVLQCVAECCSVLQCVALCCSVLQCVAVCCSVLQSVAPCRPLSCFDVDVAHMQVGLCLSHDTYVDEARHTHAYLTHIYTWDMTHPDVTHIHMRDMTPSDVTHIHLWDMTHFDVTHILTNFRTAHVDVWQDTRQSYFHEPQRCGGSWEYEYDSSWEHVSRILICAVQKFVCSWEYMSYSQTYIFSENTTYIICDTCSHELSYSYSHEPICRILRESQMCRAELFTSIVRENMFHVKLILTNLRAAYVLTNLCSQAVFLSLGR